jgi:hypothetical protein
MALYMAIFMGGTPVGAPLVGWVANIAGPRWSLSVAAASGLLAAVIGMVWIIRAKRLRLAFNRRARGLRYFRVVTGGSARPHTAEGTSKVAAEGKEQKEEGAVRDHSPDDAVER